MNTGIFNMGAYSNRDWHEDLESIASGTDSLLLPGKFGDDLITWCRLVSDNWTTTTNNRRSDAMRQGHANYGGYSNGTSAMLGFINQARMDRPSGTPDHLIGATASRRFGDTSVEYWSDFTSSVDGWTTNEAHTVILAYNQTIAGEAGWLKCSMGTGSGFREITHGTTGLTGYQKKIHLRAYFASGTNPRADGFDFATDNLEQALRMWGTQGGFTQTLDAVVAYDSDYILPEGNSVLNLTFRDASSRNFNPTVDHAIYLKDIRISRGYARPVMANSTGTYGSLYEGSVTPTGTKSINLDGNDNFLLNYEIDNLDTNSEGCWGFYYSAEDTNNVCMLSLTNVRSGSGSDYFDIWVNVSTGDITVSGSGGSGNVAYVAGATLTTTFVAVLVKINSANEMTLKYGESDGTDWSTSTNYFNQTQTGFWHDHASGYDECVNGGYGSHTTGGVGGYRQIRISSIVYVNRWTTNTEDDEIYKEMVKASP